MPVMARGIGLFLEYRKPENEITAYIRENQAISRDELVKRLFKAFPHYGLGDVQYLAIMDRHAGLRLRFGGQAVGKPNGQAKWASQPKKPDPHGGSGFLRADLRHARNKELESLNGMGDVSFLELADLLRRVG